MKTKIKILNILILSLLLFSCKKQEDDKTSYNKGEITIVTDDAFKSVVEALADAYMIHYPETKVAVAVEKEDIALLNLVENKNKIIAVSKQLSKEQVAEYERQMGIKYQVDYFAADAVVFVVNKNSEKKNISIEELKKELHSDEKKLIFDGTNASNLNFIAEKLGEKPSDLKFSIIKGNENIVKELEKYPNKIGVISLNTISRPYGKEATELREMVKILPMNNGKQDLYAEGDNLSQMKYPLTRLVYFLHNEGGFGMAKGIVRFSCTHIGQKVVEKEGLQPYNLYKREVKMR